MKITHLLGNVRKQGDGSGRLLLTNKKGNFFSVGGDPQSDYDGLFYYDGRQQQHFKILQDIRPAGCEPCELVNHFSWTERISKPGGVEDKQADNNTSGAVQEHFHLTSNAFIYDIMGYEGEVILTCDCKRLHHESEEGRLFRLQQEHDRMIINYFKYYDKAIGAHEYSLTVNIEAIPLESDLDGDLESDGSAQRPSFREIDEWREVHLPYDALRGGRPSRYVYDALAIKVAGPTRIMITFSTERLKADEKMSYVRAHADEVLDALDKYPSRLPPKDIELAASTNALDSLVTMLKGRKDRGIFAGLPWFLQFWSRDELLCLKALMLSDQYGLVKEVLMRWFEQVNGGLLPAYTTIDGSFTSTSIDASGLLCLRTLEFIQMLERKGVLNEYFTKEELGSIRDHVLMITEKLQEQRDLHGFVTNGPQETWMDTLAPGDERGREGVRIEIQALLLVIFDLGIWLCSKTKYDKGKTEWMRKERTEHARMTREWFYDQRGWLHDGFWPDGTPDARVRPNLFLAWYVAPNLLPREEWKRAFDHALKELWLDWGGLASLSTHDSQFHERYSGMDDHSYHRGDSWFFINNIAAMAMLAVDGHKYWDHLEKIMMASTHDLLYDGYLGHASEVSDACSRTPRGCWAQAWSAATLIELLHKMRVEH